MRMSSQVSHVLRKDLRAGRWLLATYCALVVFALAQALGWVGGGSIFTALLLSWYAATFVAIAIQADSPYRPDAFWATRPLDRTALFGSKVAFAAVLGAIGLIGQAVFYRAHQLPADDLIQLIATDALLLAGIMMSGMLLGAVTPNLSTFLAAGVGLLVAQTVIAQYVAYEIYKAGGDELSTQRVLPRIVFLLIELGIVLYFYRSRSRGVWLYASYWILGLLVGVLLIPKNLVAKRDTLEAPAAMRFTLEVWQDTSQFRSNSQDITLVHRFGGESSRYAYVLRAITELQSVSGRVSQIRGLGSNTELITPKPPQLASASWRIEGSRTPRSFAHSVTVTPEQRRVWQGEQSTMRVRGVIEIFEPYVTGQSPLVIGGAISSPGERIRILSVDPNNEDFLSLNISRVVRSSEPGRHAFSHIFEFGLINTETNEAIRLSEGGSHGAGAGVVLSNRASQMTQNLRLGRTERDTLPDWRIAASEQYQLVRIRWRSLGTYPVDVQVARQPPADAPAR
jgi:hypothetical protein